MDTATLLVGLNEACDFSTEVWVQTPLRNTPLGHGKFTWTFANCRSQTATTSFREYPTNWAMPSHEFFEPCESPLHTTMRSVHGRPYRNSVHFERCDMPRHAVSCIQNLCSFTYCIDLRTRIGVLAECLAQCMMSSL